MATDETGERPAEKGQEGAHRRGAAGKSGLGGVVEDAAREMVAGLIGEDDGQAGLFEDDVPPLFAGPVRHVADTFEAAKGRGRPKGARNKRSQLMADYLLAQGYRDPMQNLADLANADPWKLAVELSSATKDGTVTPLDAMKLIQSANAELLPYFHSKKPVEVDITERKLGVFVMGDLAPQRVAVDGVFSVTGVIAESVEDQ